MGLGMTPEDLASACQKLAGGNVAAFCKAAGISRDTYYRQTKPDAKVSDLTRFKVLAVMKSKGQRPTPGD